MIGQRRRQIRRNSGRFYGFRVNCENVPILPAWLVRKVWDDPRRIPYLLLWKGEWDGELKDAVRLVCHPEEPLSDWVEIKRTNGSVIRIYLVWRPLTHGGGRGLFLRCWSCGGLCRALYGYRVGNDGRFYRVQLADWQCRECAGLRYSSEGGYLRPRGMFGAFGSLPRPRLWLPYVFTSPDDALASVRSS
jgi:hypothetical protein